MGSRWGAGSRRRVGLLVAGVACATAAAGVAISAASAATPEVTTPPAYVSSLVPRGGLVDPSTAYEDAAGHLWIVDSGAGKVEEVSPTTRSVLLSIGRPGSGRGELSDPEGLAFDTLGHVFVADTGNDRVEEFTTAGAFVRTIGRAGTAAGDFDGPDGIAVSAGVLYVSDSINNRIEEFDAATGAYETDLTSDVSGPAGLTIDSSGDLWEAQEGQYDVLLGGVLEFSPKGALLRSFVGTSTFQGGFSNPTDVALDGHGHVFVAQPDTDYVIEMTTKGAYLDEFGTSGKGTLSAPFGVTVLADGRILVVDSGHDRLVFFK